MINPYKAHRNGHPSLTISNELIPVVTKVKHLGPILYTAGCFNRTVNMLLAIFGSVSSDTLY